MDLENIKQQTTWNDASESINSNFAKVDIEIEKLKNVTTRDKGYYQTVESLTAAHPTASVGSRAFVGYVAPYAVYVWDKATSKWVDTGETITDATLDLGDYYTKEDVDSLILAINRALGTKFGALYVDATTGLMSAFATEEDKQRWLEDPSDTSLVLTQVNVGVGGGGGGGTGTTSYQLSLKSNVDTTKTFSTTDTNAHVNFYFIAKQKASDSDLWEEMAGESISYTIEVATGGSAFTQVTQGYLLSGASAKFDIRRFLVAGKSTLVRIRATGDLTGLTAALTYNYSLTSMAIAPANFAWYTPFIEGESYALGGMTITGNLEKTIYVKVSSQTLAYTKVYTKGLGTDTWTKTSFFFEELVFPTTGTGVYNVEIWLDANGLESEHLNYSIMCVSASDRYSAQLVTMTNIASEVVNYANNTLFSYAIYNKGGATGDPTVLLTKTEGGSTTTFYSDTLEGVTTAAAHDFTIAVEVTSSSSDIEVGARMNYGNEQSASFPLDNSASFPATSGASFYMNPASRSNSQTNRLSIVNEATAENVTASWKNMAWESKADGWTTDDEGRSCLRLPATTKCTVTGITPMSTFGAAKTLEFTFKATNAADYNEPVITICDDASSPVFRGIKILPDKIIVHSRDKQNDLVQSYPFQDEKTIHFVITIIKNYNVTYGNLCKIYANGVGVCSFSFLGNDNWTNNGHLIMGSETADLYVYGFRQYETGFGSGDAFRNFLASLPDIATKRAENAEYYKVLNDGEKVDYDVIKETENTMVIEMLNGAELPQYGFDKEYSAKCNMWLNIFNEIDGIDPADRKLTGAYLNQKIEGQGTTSMNYYRWNLRWKMDDDYGIRITAKKNYASSMQSHKMGATALYNDVYEALGLSNGSTGRVAVYQYPVYGFLKKLKENSTNQYFYEFIGLFTVGPDKGDKKTFGFKDSGLKDTLINLEGTDHSPAGVGFDYPWSRLKYIKDNKAFGAALGGGKYEKAYEVGNCGTAETEAEIQEYLNKEFAPAYNVVFENSTMIIGTTTPLKTINANTTAWGQQKDADGHLYERYMVWIDGDYTLYYLDRETKQYTSTGINLQTQNGTPVGSTIEAKNEWFKEKRRARFKANMEKYWDLQDLLFHDVFLLIIAASDNLKKNFYPQKFLPLSKGGKWCFRQDDLDSIFRTDNQAHQTKAYSVEQFDWTDDMKTAYVFKGEDSALHRLLFECYPNEVSQMGYRILDAMASLSDTGNNAVDKLMGCFEKYFFGKAQDYFTKSAYNEDAAYTYEEAWPPYNEGIYEVDVHPLEQSLGGNEESERGWLWLRMIYCMSMFQYGTFATYTDTSLGRITYRPQYAQSFTLTPAIDLYPTILPGQGTGVTSPKRIKAGESFTLPAIGGQNTNVYIMASDYIRDIGDLRALAVDSANGTMSVGGKRLQRLKLGDVDASSVTSTLSKLTITSCPSLTVIDARNVAGLVETIDLTKCPRIEEAYFGGTAVTGVIVPSGSKITKLQLGDQTTSITLVKLPRLTSSGFLHGDLSKVEFLRVENVGFDEFELLRELYNLDGSSLRDIRIIGVNTSGTAEDIDMLANLYNDLDKDGNPHSYNGIDDKDNAVESLAPIVEGTLRIPSAVYEDTYETVSNYFKNLNIIVSGGRFIRFADQAVLDVLLAKGVGSDGGITVAQAELVTSISTWFKGNTSITSFNELSKFTGVTSIIRQAFYGCTQLSEIDLQNIEIIGSEAFYNAPLTGVLRTPSLISFDAAGSSYGAFRGAKFSKIEDLGKLQVIVDGLNTNVGGVFSHNDLLEEVVLPETLTTIGSFAFYNDTALLRINIPNSVTKIGRSAFQNCPLSQTSSRIDGVMIIGPSAFASVQFGGSLHLPSLATLENLGDSYGHFSRATISKVTSLGKLDILPDGYNRNTCGAFGLCQSLTEVTLPNTLTKIGSHSFYGCGALIKCDIPKSVTTINGYAFDSCTALSYEHLDLSNVVTLGSEAFKGVKIKKLTLGAKTLPSAANSNVQNFGDKETLEEVILANIDNIPNYSFTNYTKLKTLSLSSSVKTLGAYSFKGCKSLNPDLSNVETFKEQCLAESGVSGDLKIPSAKGDIGYRAFYKTAITSISDLGSVVRLNPYVNWSPGSPYGTFEYCTQLKTAVLPETLTTIGDSCFNACSILESMNFPESIEVIGTSAFQNCSLLQIDSLRLPNLKELGNQSFLNCKKLKRIDDLGVLQVVPGTNGSSASWPFCRCDSLEFVRLPQTVTTLGTQSRNPFDQLTSLKTLICEAVTPPTLSAAGSMPNVTIYVPDASVEAYKAAANWSQYQARIKPLSEYVEE